MPTTISVTASVLGIVSGLIDSGGVVVNTPLDLISTVSTGAYSTRKLRAAYTGMCMNVRRASDNTTQDISFVNNVLDTISLLTFAGSSNCYITAYYDQSGSGLDMTQSTTALQPQIVSAGTILTLNSIPSPAFIGNNTTRFTSLLTAIQEVAFALQQTTPTVLAGVFGSSGLDSGLRLDTVATQYRQNNEASGTANFPNNTGAVIRINGTETIFPTSAVITPTSTSPHILSCRRPTVYVPTGNLLLGGYSSTNTRDWIGPIGEAIFFAFILSTGDRTTLDTNMRSYWGTP